MRLILVRHGETHENVKGVLQGHLDSELTDLGVSQAKRAGEWLKNEKIDFAYVSDLNRAKKTAHAILEHHPDVVITYSEDLRELTYGEFEGLPREKRSEEIKRLGIKFEEFKAPGGESVIEAQERIRKVYHELVEKHYGKTVLLVSHGGVLSALYLYLLGKPFSDYRSTHPKNTAITILEVDENKKHTVHVLNSIDHL